MAPLVESNSGNFEPSYSPSNVWDQYPDHTAGVVEHEDEDAELKSPYDQPSIWWVNQTTSALIDFDVSPADQELSEIESRDADLGDRLALLVKKYAVESTALMREDSARLAILNRRVDLKYSRYTESDFEVISEADNILQKFKELEAKQ